jgi:hypothetical protein
MGLGSALGTKPFFLFTNVKAFNTELAVLPRPLHACFRFHYQTRTFKF